MEAHGKCQAIAIFTCVGTLLMLSSSPEDWITGLKGYLQDWWLTLISFLGFKG